MSFGCFLTDKNCLKLIFCRYDIIFYYLTMRGYSIQNIFLTPQQTVPLKERLCEDKIYTNESQFLVYANQRVRDFCHWLFQFTTGRVTFKNKKYERTEEGFEDLYNAMQISLDDIKKLEPSNDPDEVGLNNKLIIYDSTYEYDLDDDDIEMLAVVCHQLQ
jgi:hypothetical protein